MYKQATLLILSFIFILTANPLQAQDAVKTGAKGGINFANISNSDFESRTGFVVGGFAKFSIPMSPFSIQPEALYSQQGGEIDGNEVRLDYLQVPVLFKYALIPAGPAQPNLFLGPYAGLRLVAEQEGGTGGILGGSSNIENETESVDYGLIAGAGVDIEVGDSIFTMDARYTFGAADVFKNGDGKHRVFAITFGISLPSGN